ncbi:MAG: DinB family protein [Actinobacteria bacterium]|nr:DinB family protein [Actinomycetota bacterium]
MTIPSEIRAIVAELKRRRTRRGPDPYGVRLNERATLDGTLDWYRQVCVNKVTGLSRDDATRGMTATGMSPLGIVKHLAWAEDAWFRERFADEPVDLVDTVEESMRIVPGDTVDSVLASYAESCGHSRRIAAAAPGLDSLSKTPSEIRGHVALRWILVHMIEETARHAGHLDIMREQIDGLTGD